MIVEKSATKNFQRYTKASGSQARRRKKSRCDRDGSHGTAVARASCGALYNKAGGRRFEIRSLLSEQARCGLLIPESRPGIVSIYLDVVGNDEQPTNTRCIQERWHQSGSGVLSWQGGRARANHALCALEGCACGYACGQVTGL